MVSFKPTNVVMSVSDDMHGKLFMLILSLNKVFLGDCSRFIGLSSSPIIHILNLFFLASIISYCLLMLLKYSELSYGFQLAGCKV